MRGYIKFVDVANKKTDVWLTGIPDTATIEQLETFASSLKLYLNPAITEYGLIKNTYVDASGKTAAGLGSIPMPDTSNKTKAIVYMNYFDEFMETRQLVLNIPNPHMIANFENFEGVGYRMQPLTGAELARQMETVLSLDHVNFVKGVLEYREGESNNAGNGIWGGSYLAMQDITGDICKMYLPCWYLGVSGMMDALYNNGGLSLTRSKILYGVGADREFKSPPGSSAMLTAAEENGWDSVDLKAKVKFSFIYGGQRRHMTMLIPGVKASAFELQPGRKGFSLLKSVGDSIATNLTTFYTSAIRPLKYESGHRDVINLQPQ